MSDTGGAAGDPGDEAGRRRATRAAVQASGVVVAVVLLGVVVVWAAVAGPSEVFRGPGPLAATGQTVAPTTAPIDAVQPSSAPLAPDDLAVPGWANALFTGLVFALAALLVGLLGWVILRLARAWLGRYREPPDVQVDFDVLDPPTAAAAAIRRGVAAQEQVLAEGAARDAIIACWQRFEAQATEAGMSKERWETPAEFVIRMLDVADADPAAISELAALYREARFSEHELGESERERARSALARLHGSRREPA